MKGHLTLFSLLLVLCFSTQAQNVKRKCASHRLHVEKTTNDQDYAERRTSLSVPTENNSIGKKTTAETVYTIPVVVHVIHNGEALNSGANISEAQVNSAITALNEDFRALNADSLTPSHAFYSLKSDISIEFVLAKQDANGATTTGINRYNKGQAFWEVTSFDATVKPATAWDRTKYMNIWVVTIGGADDGTLGYATFPGTTTVDDGVVIGTTFFGNTGNVSPGYDLNRTATHEVGHFLNLSHIWGDATCGDDFVSDTPTQEVDNAGCPTFPHNAASSCSPGVNGEMFMNYMDYTDDKCMSMFTIGQKDRMRAALTGSRLSLTTSLGSVNSVQNNVINANVTIYPNPSSGVINATVPNAFGLNQIQVISLTGQVVYDSNANGTTISITLPSVANGTYIVKLYGKEGVANKELILLR